MKVAIVLFAFLALAGCGGGSGVSDNPDYIKWDTVDSVKNLLGEG